MEIGNLLGFQIEIGHKEDHSTSGLWNVFFVEVSEVEYDDHQYRYHNKENKTLQTVFTEDFYFEHNYQLRFITISYRLNAMRKNFKGNVWI